jgi:uncharacterized protein YigE (DUF2233 family)
METKANSNRKGTMRLDDVNITVRARAFSGEGMRTHRCKVDERTGTVRVWDSVAGHYTTCHALSDRSERRIRTLVANDQEKDA